MVPLPPRPVVTALVRARTSDTERSLYAHSLLRCHQPWHSGSRSSTSHHRGFPVTPTSQYAWITAVQFSLPHAHAAGLPTIAHSDASHGLPTPPLNDQPETSCMRRRDSSFSLQGSLLQLFDEMSLTSSLYVSHFAPLNEPRQIIAAGTPFFVDASALFGIVPTTDWDCPNDRAVGLSVGATVGALRHALDNRPTKVGRALDVQRAIVCRCS